MDHGAARIEGFVQGLLLVLEEREVAIDGGLLVALAFPKRKGLLEEKRVPERAAPDHDGIDAVHAMLLDCLLGSHDIAVAYDRKRAPGLDLADEIPVSRPAIALRPRAAVNRDPAHA